MKKDQTIVRHITPPTDQEINQICEIINSNLGFNYNAQKRYLIESRLNKRLTQIGITNYRDYLTRMKDEPLEQSILYEYLTTNVTSFFREPAQFDYLATTLLPNLRVSTKKKKLRCWSAGCSSGEEPYSLAITLKEAFGPEWDIKVLATDINAEKLQIGMNGVYSKDAVANIPLKWRQRYFKVEGKNSEQVYHVVPELRMNVVFRLMNLLDEETLPNTIRVDIIFCRNVFIYLSKEARQKILNHFYGRLNRGGHLFLGHSESINVTEDPSWISQGKSIYRKKD